MLGFGSFMTTERVQQETPVAGKTVYCLTQEKVSRVKENHPCAPRRPVHTVVYAHWHDSNSSAVKTVATTGITDVQSVGKIHDPWVYGAKTTAYIEYICIITKHTHRLIYIHT